MRALNPKKLAEYLKVLRGAGVAEFEQDGFRVRFAPPPEQLDELEVDESELTEEERRIKREKEKRDRFVNETWSAD